MFIKYQISDVDVDITIRTGLINSAHINHIELIEDRAKIRIFLTNQVLDFCFLDHGQAMVAYLAFQEALQCIGTNHEFIKLTVIPNF